MRTLDNRVFDFYIVFVDSQKAISIKVFDYEDVQLIPNKCIVDSRSECDTIATSGKHSFRMPIVSTNMQTIIDETITEALTENGCFYIMHRFDGEARVPFIEEMQQRSLTTSTSVGAKEREYAFAGVLAREDLVPDYVTVDIAHGHLNAVINMVQHLKKFLPETFVIAGNIGTPEAVRKSEDAGADVTEVGTEPRRVCITEIKTGFGIGGQQLAAPRQCAKAARKPIIVDSGIQTYGDVAGSVRFGATMAMTGSLFIGHEESPGEAKVEDGVVYKGYSGNASEF